MSREWIMWCDVERVIDGDSLVVSADLGWGLWRHKTHVRLLGIDAHERLRNSIQANEAILFVERWLAEHPGPLRLTSSKLDSFGRVLGSITNGEDDLAADLLSAGLVKVWGA